MKRLVLLLSLIAVLITTSCNRQRPLSFGTVQYVSTDNVDYVVDPSSGSDVSFGVDGVEYFQIIGPYLVILSYAEEGLFAVLDKTPPYTVLGYFFKRGRGPGELPSISIPGDYGIDDSGDLYADLNNLAGKIIRWNITKSLEEGRTVTEEIGETGPNTLTVLNLGEKGIYYKELSPNKDSQQRFVIDNNSQKYVPENMRLLNSAVLQNKEDDGARFNILSTVSVYDRQTERFMEASSGLNTIHLYSLDNSFAKTYYIGDKVYDYNELAERSYADRPITTIDGKHNGKFASFLYLDVLMSAFARPESIPRLLIVPWDGSDLIQVQLPEFVTSFDIDLDSGRLYCYNSFTEILKSYDIRVILDRIK